MAAALSRRAAALESRSHDAGARVSHSGDRLRRPVEGDSPAVGGPRRRVRERWADRNPSSTANQTGSAPCPRMAWTNPRGGRHRRGFRVRDPKRQRMVEKSSLRDEAKMHPPQASGKRREFDLSEVSFVVNINNLNRGIEPE